MKVRTIYMVVDGCYRAMGHRRPDHVYWDPNWASVDIGTLVGRGRDSDGLLPGLVLKSQDASLLHDIPECFKADPFHLIYLILVGDDPPLWFAWTDIMELEEEDNTSESG